MSKNVVQRSGSFFDTEDSENSYDKCGEFKIWSFFDTEDSENGFDKCG